MTFIQIRPLPPGTLPYPSNSELNIIITIIKWTLISEFIIVLHCAYIKNRSPGYQYTNFYNENIFRTTLAQNLLYQTTL